MGKKIGTQKLIAVIFGLVILTVSSVAFSSPRIVPRLLVVGDSYAFLMNLRKSFSRALSDRKICFHERPAVATINSEEAPPLECFGPKVELYSGAPDETSWIGLTAEEWLTTKTSKKADRVVSKFKPDIIYLSLGGMIF